MEFRYLGPTFKTGGQIWAFGASLHWGKRARFAFLIKEGRMTSQVYVDQVLKQLGLPFYNELMEERGSMI